MERRGSRMKRRASFLVLTLLLLPHARLVPGQQPITNRDLAFFERYLDALRRQAKIVGMTAAIVDRSGTLFEKGFGFSDLARRSPAAPDTLYHIASLTKTFASTLLLQCVEAGRLSLDEPMRRYSTAVPDQSATVRHVLSMTSDSPAGSMFRYDGDRYGTLTPVVEACTGKPFRQAVAENLLDRVGMPETVPGHDLESALTTEAALFPSGTLAGYRAALTRVAQPYRIRNGRAEVPESPPKGINAAAGLVSTVRDLARYARALDDQVLLRSDSQDLAWTPARSPSGGVFPYGLGWFVQHLEGARTVWHYGLWGDSFSALIVKARNRDLTMILLANSDGLSSFFPLADGDLSTSPFGVLFVRAFR